LSSDERSRRAIEVAEAFADGAASDVTLAAAAALARVAHRHSVAAFITARRDARGKMRRPVKEAASRADSSGVAAWAASTDPLGFYHFTTDCGGDELTFYDTEAAVREVFQGHAVLVRDVFCSPFRPGPALDPAWLAWRGGVVRELARAAYEERRLPEGTLEPARMSVLADALEDAGCHDAELLGHLRGPGQHVRGCWTIDLLLSKS
jgi:hypothetical protein